MTESAHLLDLESEIDLLAERLRRWIDSAPSWGPAARCRKGIDHLLVRMEQLAARLSAPLVVGVMGGTGVGKSSLVNALVGAEVSRADKIRPTTDRPQLIARPGITPEALGIPAEAVHLVSFDHPLLDEMVLVDCPDPDTSENGAAGDDAPSAATDQADNLSRLRAILPHCDVLLLVSTQEKYRSAAVRREWVAAAPAAQWLFVQTHADHSDDIRDDWRRSLLTQLELPTDRPAEFFFVDSSAALEASRTHRPLPGEFAQLVEYLRRAFGRVAQTRLRHSNLLGLVDHTLQRCGESLDERLTVVKQLEQQVIERQQAIEQQLAAAIERAALDDRRRWEQELLSRIAQRWGATPFAMVIRTYQSLGSILLGFGAARARSVTQLAFWGGVAAWNKLKRSLQSSSSLDELAAAYIDEEQLRESAFVLRGFVGEAEMSVEPLQGDALARQTEQAVKAALGRMRRRVDESLDALVRRNSGWFTRGLYECAWLGVVGLVLFRLGKNFFYDSWWPEQPAPIEGIHAYLAGVFWVVAWSAILMLSFSGRLRRSIAKQLRGPLTSRESSGGDGPFRELLEQCRQAEQFVAECHRLRGTLKSSARPVAVEAAQS